MTVKGFSSKSKGNTGENTKFRRLENVVAVGNATDDTSSLSPKPARGKRTAEMMMYKAKSPKDVG